MDSLIINPLTKTQLQAMLSSPPHALIFVGPQGVGKRALAEAWSRQLTNQQNVTIITPAESGSIAIESIRDLYKTTRTQQTNRQIVIIDNAQTLSTEAQNAFLKLLEEPHPNLTFVLTAPTVDSLLPTIMSRAQTVNIQLASPEQLHAAIKAQKPDLSHQELTQLTFIASGRPAILNQLLADEQLLAKYMQIMQQAKTLLAAPMYERLAAVDALSKDRLASLDVLNAMGNMCKMQITHDQSPRWTNLAQALEVCLSRLNQNGNLRAQLTHLFLSY